MWAIAPDARLLDLNHDVRQFADPRWRVPAVAGGRLPAGRRPPRGRGPGGRDRAPTRRRASRPRRPARRAGQRPPVAGGPRARWRHRRLGDPRPRACADEVSSTFHGRDIFSPVAARLAGGLDPRASGRPSTSRRSSTSPARRPRFGTAGSTRPCSCHRSFGNVRLAGQPGGPGGARGPARRRAALPRVRRASGSTPFRGTRRSAGRSPAPRCCTRTPTYGGLGLAVNLASAAERFDLALDTPVRLEPA